MDQDAANLLGHILAIQLALMIVGVIFTFIFLVVTIVVALRINAWFERRLAVRATRRQSPKAQQYPIRATQSPAKPIDQPQWESEKRILRSDDARYMPKS